MPLIWDVNELCGLYFDFYLFFYFYLYFCFSLFFYFYLSLSISLTFYFYLSFYLNYLNCYLVGFVLLTFSKSLLYLLFFYILLTKILLSLIFFLFTSNYAIPQAPNKNLLIILWFGIFFLNKSSYNAYWFYFHVFFLSIGSYIIQSIARYKVFCVFYIFLYILVYNKYFTFYNFFILSLKKYPYFISKFCFFDNRLKISYAITSLFDFNQNLI